ncbi:MAG: aminotransferase class V-fold PLP-dependent enzyme [Opitutaceae bacterium]|nr:aminotransferase class V-fold PLP-dependent enzyme [Opitutaceae bacterium]
MKPDRRSFLRRATLGAAGLMAAPALKSGEPAAPGALPAYDERAPEPFWAAVRTQFPLSRDLIYFNTGGLGPASQPALAKVEETTRKLQARSEHGHGLFAEARGVVARFFGAQPEEIAFVRNASEGNSIVAAGLKLDPGDEVIFETHAHPGGSFPWLNQQTLRGITVRLFEPDPRDPAGNVARIAALMNARTRVVQVSHVTAPTGLVMPVAEIAALCHGRGVWFHVDGAQSAGMLPFTLRETGCDSYTTSGHKWLGGPLETGVLFVRRDRMNEVAAAHVGAYSGELDGLPGELRIADSAMRFEYGTRNVAAALGLAEAIRLQERIGTGRIAARIRGLADRVFAGLARLPGVEVLTPAVPELRAAMVTFRTARVPHDQLFGRLLRDHAMRTRPVTEQKLNALRVSTHLFNSPAECDALVAAVEKILRSA